MADALLSYRNVEVSYDGTPVVHDVSFDLAPGTTLCVIGESGSGKSTLLRAGMGLLGSRGKVTRGDIWYQGESVPDLSESRLRELRGSDFALVFQDSLSAFNPLRKMGAQLFEAARAHGASSREQLKVEAGELFTRLGLSDVARVWDSYPYELSGGMGQRVGIACALLARPRVFFADEPTSALDIDSQAQVIELLRAAQADDNMGVVLVTHQVGVARELADDVLVLKDGVVQEYGAAAEVLSQPQAAYTRELLSSAAYLDE